MGMISQSTIVLRRLEDYVGDDKYLMRKCIILSFAATVILSVVPYFCGRVLDWLVSPDTVQALDLSMLLDLCTFIILLVVLWYVMTCHSKNIMSKMSLQTARRMRNEMNDKLLRVPISYIDGMPPGDLSSRFTADMPAVSKLISNDYIGFIVHFTMIIGIFIMMFITSPILAILYAILMPITVLIIRYLIRDSEEDYRRQKAAVAELNTQMSDIISAHKTIKAENMEEVVKKRFTLYNDEFTEAFIRSNTRTGMIAPVVSIMANIGYLVTVIAGVLLIYGGSMPVGMFLSFLIYVRLVNSPLLMTVTVFDGMREEIISLERILDVLEEPDEEVPSEDDGFVMGEGRVSFRDVSFSYAEGREIIHSVSFDIEPGKITALVGPTASGKTTLANLMMGFYSDYTGSIEIDGREIRTIPRKDLGHRLVAVLQNPWTFEGTIRENVLYNMEGVSEETFLDVCRLTGLDDYVGRLTDGYETRIGNEMNRLPLAQRRMLAISRAIMSDPKILILDEAVAGLDPITGQTIFDRLKDRVEGRTVLIISHNLALIDQADTVIRIDEGRIVNE